MISFLIPRLLLLVVIFVLTGCSISNPLLLEQKQLNKGSVYTTSAGVRGIYVKSPSDLMTVCSEPAPDSAIDLYESLSIDLSLIQWGDDNDREQLGMSQGSLGGRSSNVLIARELMFRLCEFYSNTVLTNEQKIELFKTTLETVESINKQNLGKGTTAEAEVSLSDTKLIEQAVSDSDEGANQENEEQTDDNNTNG